MTFFAATGSERSSSRKPGRSEAKEALFGAKTVVLERSKQMPAAVASLIRVEKLGSERRVSLTVLPYTIEGAW